MYRILDGKKLPANLDTIRLRTPDLRIPKPRIKRDSEALKARLQFIHYLGGLQVKLHKGWLIITSTGDEILINSSDFGTLRWAKRHNYSITRTFILR